MRPQTTFARRLATLAIATLGVLPAARTRGEPDAVRAVLFRLPFPAGVSYAIFQGNDQGPSHADVWNKYAYDFSPMAIGSDVCASADGVVTYIREDTKGPTNDPADNNEVAILHADETVAVYCHLQKDGALVDVGQRVFAGDLIGKSGDTGKSGGPHLHWCLKQGHRLGPAIPSKFEDVPGSGVPKTGDVVTSGNVAVRPIIDAMDRLDAAYDRAKRLECLESMVPVLVALGRPAPPADLAAILARYVKRDDARTTFVERRDALLARHRADADAAVEAVASAREGGRFDEAVAHATFGRLDYASVPAAVAKFQAALAALKPDPAFAKATFVLGPRLAWRRELVRAFDLEAKARDRTAAGKKAGWKTVLGIYDGLVARAPTPESKATLAEYVTGLKAKFGKAE